MNLLTDEECNTLFKPHGGAEKVMSLNPEYEICVGKKHSFPHSLISYHRKNKSKKYQDKEKAEAVKYGLAKWLDSEKKEVKWLTRWKPTKWFYRMNKNQTRVSLGTKQDYPYDWFIGGVDSCQGDSGGPLWRNIKVKQQNWNEKRYNITGNAYWEMVKQDKFASAIKITGKVGQSFFLIYLYQKFYCVENNGL